MKTFKNLLIALIATLCGINAYAYDFEVDGIYYKYQSIQKKTVAVTSRVYGIETYSGSVAIPSTVSYLDVEYNVTEIDYYAFSNCDELEEIEIPKGMILIGDNAFKDCINLKQVIINEGLERIGDNAFEGCTSLEEITLPSTFYRIGEWAFYNSGIKSVVFTGDKCATIGYMAFYNTKLSEAHISNVSVIGDMAFYGTQLKEVVFGDNLKSIGDYAFYGTPLKKAEFGTNLESVGVHAFYMTDIESVDLSKVTSLKSIDYAFSDCKKLVSVKLPQTLEEIGDEVFKGCAMLENVELPQALETIGKATFYGCSRLKALDFPASLKNVHGGAFNGCESLTSLEFPSKVWLHLWDYKSIVDGCNNLKMVKLPGVALPIYPIFNRVNLETVYAVYGYDNYVPDNMAELFNAQTYETAVLRVPVGTKDLYSVTSPWKYFANIEEDSSLEMVGIDNVHKEDNCAIWYAEGKIRHNIATDVDIEIFEADGRSVLRCESASQSVDISDLPSGVYIVIANFSGRTIEEKIVVR